MQYAPVTHSKNGKATMKMLDESLTSRMKNRERLSDGDVLRINRMYKCGQQGKSLEARLDSRFGDNEDEVIGEDGDQEED